MQLGLARPGRKGNQGSARFRMPANHGENIAFWTRVAAHTGFPPFILLSA